MCCWPWSPIRRRRPSNWVASAWGRSITGREGPASTMPPRLPIARGPAGAEEPSDDWHRHVWAEHARSRTTGGAQHHRRHAGHRHHDAHGDHRAPASWLPAHRWPWRVHAPPGRQALHRVVRQGRRPSAARDHAATLRLSDRTLPRRSGADTARLCRGATPAGMVGKDGLGEERRDGGHT